MKILRGHRLGALIAVTAIAVACSNRDAVVADAGSTVDGVPSDGGVNDAADGALSDAAAASDGADASTDAGPDTDAGAWTHYELPESGYPNGWLIASQGNSPNNWTAETTNGASTLNLFTSDVGGGGSCANSSACPASQCVGGVCRQRVKQKSPRSDLDFGRYEWRVFIPAFTPADAQFSVGAFVYADDEHELDFECGPGTSAARSSATLAHLGGSTGPALAGDMLCYLTSQGNPAVSTAIALPAATWHTFALVMTPGASGDYAITWRIDDVAVQTRQLTYGPADACAMYVPGRKCTWQAFISTENLGFVGDTYPKVRNDAYFDWFRYRP